MALKQDISVGMAEADRGEAELRSIFMSLTPDQHVELLGFLFSISKSVNPLLRLIGGTASMRFAIYQFEEVQNALSESEG